jgi:hypothetical protein
MTMLVSVADHARRVEVRHRLEDPRRALVTKDLLVALRCVGLEQLSMQTIGTGSLDTQAGGALAGAGALALVDIARRSQVAPLVLTALSALFSLWAILSTSRGKSGPTPTQILHGRRLVDEQGVETFLSDEEAEWVLIGDVEVTIHQNTELLDRKASAVFRATAILLIGIVVLVLSEAI